MNKGRKVKSTVKKDAPLHKRGELTLPESLLSTKKEDKKKKKQNTKAAEELECMCCKKEMWVKGPTGALIPGCKCGLYLPGHRQCGKCSLHCPCEGRGHHG